VLSKDIADCTTIINFVGSPGETSVMKLVFQVKEVEHPEIPPQHTVCKEPDNFRLNKECPGSWSCHCRETAAEVCVCVSCHMLITCHVAWKLEVGGMSWSKSFFVSSAFRKASVSFVMSVHLFTSNNSFSGPV